MGNIELNTMIIAIKYSIDFCTDVINDPATPPNKVVKFTNYRNKLTKQQEENTADIVANSLD
jgi:hypothetical protein